MIVVCFIGIGICVLVLMSGEATPPPPEGDNMSTTSVQLAQMLREDEKSRRRFRIEHGLSSTRHGTRIPHKRHGDVKGNKGNSRARGWDNV